MKQVWKTISESVPVTRDAYGNPIVNSQGDYFDPPPEIEVSKFVCILVHE